MVNGSLDHMAQNSGLRTEQLRDEGEGREVGEGELDEEGDAGEEEDDVEDKGSVVVDAYAVV
jgi:hypothetical protein